MSQILLAEIWGVLLIATIALAVLRKHWAGREVDALYLTDCEVGQVQKQQSLATKLTQIDRWGKVLTVATVLFGIALLGRFIYTGWIASTNNLK